MTRIYFRKTYKEFFDFVSNAKDEIIILSPFIKLAPLKLLLEKVKPGIEVIVVARWKFSDLVFGSSDVEVFEYLKSLNHSFYINNKIHLKIIVEDKKNILLGSANITESGLGLLESSNIEAIAVDNLDEEYLPSVYSILRESLLVDDALVKKISKKLNSFRDINDKQNKIKVELEKIEKSIFIKSQKNILAYDFPFTLTPEVLLKSLKTKNFSNAMKHDLQIYKLTRNNVNKEILKQAFLKSNAYLWQQEHIKGEFLFGKYSELLHSAIVDNPKPYRKQVKELVANMFNWTEDFSSDFSTIKYNHTRSIIRK